MFGLLLLLLVASVGWAKDSVPASASEHPARTGLDSKQAVDPALRIRRGEQARAEGRLGDALVLLSEALRAARGQADPALRLAAAGAYAGALVDDGRPGEAVDLLEPALEEASAQQRDRLVAALSNELARAFERIDGDAQAPGSTPRAVALYAEAGRAAEQAGAARLAFRALANAAHAAAASGEAVAARALGARASALGSSLEGDSGAAMSWLRLGRAYAWLAREEVASDPAEGAQVGEPEESLRGPALAADRAAARACFVRALEISKGTGDRRARSHARGGLAALAAQGGQLESAKAAAWEALRDAQFLDDEELVARWHALLARVARESGRVDEAIEHFEQAATRLVAIRPALSRAGLTAAPATAIDGLGGGLELELVDLLLERAATQAEEALGQLDLRRALRSLERFKADELRDYFEDECVDAYREQIVDPTDVSTSAAVIYPVSFPDRLVLLVSNGGRIRQFVTPVPRALLDTEVRLLSRWLVDRTLVRYRAPAKQLHAWIMDPLAEHLEAIGVDTLVFVPGGSLRTIPLAALFDGERFLVERYAIATIPGLELTDPRPLDPEGLEVFLGGLTQSRLGFPALPAVAEELARVRADYGGTLLLDEDFEREAIQNALERRSFGLVHLATHAQFGSTSEDTFLLAWDGRIGVDALAEAIGVFRYRETPLQLLVLSACETAAGDERAALGLAGVAVKAGARSALASLWSVGDLATQKVISVFYDALRDPGVSRAEALRRAQRTLIADPALSHPANWAPFLMISGWL